jgi:hypothetical protein
MPEIIKQEDTPLVVVHDTHNPQTPYVILDAKGIMHAQFVTREEADAFVAAVNEPEPKPEPEPEEPALPQEDADDTADEQDQEDPEQPEEDDMPRGIPNKKAAVKKRVTAAKSKAKKRVAASVKKTAKKFASKVKKAVKKRKKARVGY